MVHGGLKAFVLFWRSDVIDFMTNIGNSHFFSTLEEKLTFTYYRALVAATYNDIQVESPIYSSILKAIITIL